MSATIDIERRVIIQRLEEAARDISGGDNVSRWCDGCEAYLVKDRFDTASHIDMLRDAARLLRGGA